MTFLACALAACAAPQPAREEARDLVWPPPPDQPRYYYERTIRSSADITETTNADLFRQFATGERMSGRGLDKPFDIVATGGRLFISDTVSRRVMALDIPAKTTYEFGTKGQGRLAKPLGMAVDGTGRLYVCDGTTRRIQVYNLDGKHIKTIGDETILKRPSAVAVNRDGSRIYVVDTGGVDNVDHTVRTFDGSGAHLFDIGGRGTDPGKFNLPLNAAVGPDGRLYVVDTGNFRIQVFSPDGEFLFAFGSAGRRPGQFSHPKGIAVDHESKIFVADTGFGNFQIFNKEGRILMFVGDRSDRGGPGQYLLPAGISVDVDGRVYMIDQFFRKVDVFRPAELPAESPVGQPATDVPQALPRSGQPPARAAS